MMDRQSNPLDMDMVEKEDEMPADGKVEQPTNPGTHKDTMMTMGTHNGDMKVEQLAPPPP